MLFFNHTHMQFAVSKTVMLLEIWFSEIKRNNENAWNIHTMGRFMDESLETTHGNIRHKQLCVQQKVSWKRKVSTSKGSIDWIDEISNNWS